MITPISTSTKNPNTPPTAPPITATFDFEEELEAGGGVGVEDCVFEEVDDEYGFRVDEDKDVNEVADGTPVPRELFDFTPEEVAEATDELYEETAPGGIFGFEIAKTGERLLGVSPPPVFSRNMQSSPNGSLSETAQV